jgi:hypothetical protein
MSNIEDRMPQLEVDAWERRRQRIKKFYIEERGMSEDDADEKATADVRRDIRGR